MDCVDHVSDHEGRAEVCYHPGYDLTRIGRADWPWRWCRRCRTAPGFVYETPVTNRVMARIQAEELTPDEVPPTMAPPPLLPDDLWTDPNSPIDSEDGNIGVYPLGPLFDSEDSAPILEDGEPIIHDADAPGLTPLDSVPPSPAPRESSSPEARNLEPTPAVSHPPAGRDNDRRTARDAALNNSGVVRLFDDGEVGASSPGITVHSRDQSEFGPISMESWLSDRPLGETDVETASGDVEQQPSTTAESSQVPQWAASPHDSETEEYEDVLPSSATSPAGASSQTEQAEWWESRPPRPSTQNTSTDSTSTDVFGPVPFAEWQSVTE